MVGEDFKCVYRYIEGVPTQIKSMMTSSGNETITGVIRSAHRLRTRLLTLDRFRSGSLLLCQKIQVVSVSGKIIRLVSLGAGIHLEISNDDLIKVQHEIDLVRRVPTKAETVMGTRIVGMFGSCTSVISVVITIMGNVGQLYATVVVKVAMWPRIVVLIYLTLQDGI
jgi:hypothetical protein